MIRADLEELVSQARTIADIIRALAKFELGSADQAHPSFFVFLADELEARFERIDVELNAMPDPPAMHPKQAKRATP